jgi:hypothetical protein
VGTIGFSVPCASDVREGFTPGTALRRTFKPQSLRGFVRAIGLSFPFGRGGIRLHDVFRRGSIGRYIDRMLKPDCSDVSGGSPGTSQVSGCVSKHLRLCSGHSTEPLLYHLCSRLRYLRSMSAPLEPPTRACRPASPTMK